MERNQQDSGPSFDSAQESPIQTVGVVGAGIMGTAIAAAHVKHGLSVVITDADEQALAQADGKISEGLSATMPDSEARQQVHQRVEPTDDVASVAACDLVIESVVEILSAKQELFDRLEPLLPSGTILTSNTSTIPIGRLAAGLKDPGRFCGLHFFHPVAERPLVEVIRGDRTTDRTVTMVVAHAKAIGKTPIVVDDGPGFLVNRLLFPYLSEATELLLEGVAIQQIERAATEFGMAKGPLTLLDEIGLDTALRGGWVLTEAFADRMNPAPLLVTMIKAGRLGRKSGAGFFAYDHGKAAAEPDRSIEPIIAQWARQPREHTPHSIVTRLLLPMVLEATRILEEGKVREPGDIDLCVRFGLGFPANRGGLLRWADTLSATRVVEMLQSLQPLGPRYHPTPLLEELARNGGSFHEDG